MKLFTLSKSQHAPLYKRYDLTAGDFITVGDTKGTYGQEDRETGAEYKCLGTPSSHGKVQHSSDFKCGLFYPETIFVWGRDEEGRNDLSHVEVEKFCHQLGYTSTRRVILPRGYAKGKMTWDRAVMYCPPECQPKWYYIEETLRRKFPTAQIWKSDFFVEVSCL